MRKINWTELLLFVVGTELAGALSAMVSGGDFSAFYRSLERPPFAPPGWLFPVAWAVLYALMGISAYLIWREEAHPLRKTALTLYGVQLFVNVLWPPVFFRLRSFAGATAVIIILLALIIAMIPAFWRIWRAAAWLNLPYLLWTAYAAYLTIGILILNGM